VCPTVGASPPVSDQLMANSVAASSREAWDEAAPRALSERLGRRRPSATPPNPPQQEAQPAIHDTGTRSFSATSVIDLSWVRFKTVEQS
jgi:hypothetical protein